jgi:hypothetical protein
MENNFNDPRTYVLDMERKGFVVVDTKDGLQTISLSDLAHKDTTSLLATCSRDFATLLSSEGSNPRWRNDYVMALVVKYLKEQNLQYRNLINKYEDQYGTISD